MARTAITPTTLTVGGSAADAAGTGTTAGAANGVSIANSTPEQTILRVSNASGGSLNALVKAGAGAAATAAGQGDLTVAVATGTTVWIGPFESARHAQADGSLYVDASGVLTVTAFKVNRH